MFWAQIEEDKITFYSEDFLKNTYGNLYNQIKSMQKNFINFQQSVSLNQEKIRILEQNGIRVLKSNFLALKGRWHWFTGTMKMDAFRLIGDALNEIQRNGFLEVYLKPKVKNTITTHTPETHEVTPNQLLELLEKLDSKTTLLIVSCTPDKVWEHDPTAPDFVPARYVYRGERFVKFLRWVEDNEIEKRGFYWIILSGKYGFIEPWHPISKYDVNLSNLNDCPVSEETLKNQVCQKRWWRDKNGLLKEVYIKDFTDIICVNCSSTYKYKIRKSLSNVSNLHLLFVEL